MEIPDLASNRLTFLKDIPPRRGHPYASYLCSCGEQKVIRKRHVDTGKIKSCGCLHLDAVKFNPSKRRVYGRTAQGTAWAKFLYSSRSRGKEVSITKEQWLTITQMSCAYCGRPPEHRVKASSGIGDFICNGVDRVDNSLGYVLDNCAPCCFMCNSFKSDFTKSEFLEHVNRIAAHKPTASA